MIHVRGRANIRLWVGLFSLLGAVLIVGVVLAARTVISQVEIPSFLRQTLANPSVLDGSQVIAGDPYDFLLGNTQAAKVKLSAKGTVALLGSRHVLTDCDSVGRTCAHPIWAEPRLDGDPFQVSFNGLTLPDSGVCAESYEKGSHGYVLVKMACVARASRMLYYFGWTIGR